MPHGMGLNSRGFGFFVFRIYNGFYHKFKVWINVLIQCFKVGDGWVSIGFV